MSTQYRLVKSGKTASGGCSAGQGSSEPVAPRIYYFIYYKREATRSFETILANRLVSFSSVHPQETSKQKWYPKWGARALQAERHVPWECAKKINHVGLDPICAYISVFLYICTARIACIL
jgi:hypothetical protein